MPLLTPEQLREACEELSNDNTLPSWYTSTLKTIISKNVTINDWNKLLTYVQQLAIDDRNVLSVADLLIAQIIALTEVYDSKADWENLTRTITTGGIITALSSITDDNIVLNANTKIQLKIGNITNAAKLEMTNETSGVAGGRVVISGIETDINRLRIMQVDGLGSPITLNGNNATMHFTNDGLEVPSKFKIGNTEGDYWQFYGDTLSLKGSSHTIESNSGDAGITFDDNVLEFGAGNKVQVNAPTVNVDGNTVVLGDEPTSGGGGIVINPTYSPSCLKVIKDATGSNAVVQVKTATDKIPFEILKNGKMNITSGEVNFVGSTVKNTGVTGGKIYTSYFAPNAIQLQKQEEGITSSPISIVTDAGVLISTDLMTLDPYEFYLKGGSRVSFGHPNTKVLFDNDNGAVYFQTSQAFTDSIYINNKKLATENYVDTLLGAKADLTNTTQIITADKVNVNEVRDLIGSGNVKTTYTSNSITNEVKYGNYNSNQVVVRNDYVRMSYDEFETAYSSVAVEKTGVYITVGLIDSKVLQLSTSTKKLTLGGNEIIDTNNATTELFLTDAEMNTLISEVFD